MNEQTLNRVIASIRSEFKTKQMIANDTMLCRETVYTYLCFLLGRNSIIIKKYGNAEAYKLK